MNGNLILHNIKVSQISTKFVTDYCSKSLINELQLKPIVVTNIY